MPIDKETIRQAVTDALKDRRICIRLQEIERVLHGSPDDRNDNGMKGDINQMMRRLSFGSFIWRTLAQAFVCAIAAALIAKVFR